MGQFLLAQLKILLTKRGTVFLTDSLLGIDLLVKYVYIVVIVCNLNAGGVVPDDVPHPPHLVSARITPDHGPSLRGGPHQGQARHCQHESQHPEENSEEKNRD